MALLKIPSLGGVARSDSGREAPGWVGFRSRTPLKSPCPRGDAIFIECGAATRHENLPCMTNFAASLTQPQALLARLGHLHWRA